MSKGKQPYKEIARVNFLQLMDEVLRSGACKNRQAFAKSVGEYLPNISMMEKGGRTPTIEQVAMACELYGYSMNWVVMNIGDKRIDQSFREPLTERVTKLEQQVLVLQRTMREKG
ncbi:MAG: hypothetical protein ACT4OJ_11875 [Bacteroidota bacterium]